VFQLSPLWLAVLRGILERARTASNEFSDCHKQRAEAGQAATSDTLRLHLLKPMNSFGGTAPKNP
jgi:hypothetical protein